MSNNKLRDSNSLDTRQPHEPRDKQPAREADEWSVANSDPTIIVDANGLRVADCFYEANPLSFARSKKNAKRIVTDHARAALVPRLVEALKAVQAINRMCDKHRVSPELLPVCVEDRLAMIDDALAAARKAGVE